MKYTKPKQLTCVTTKKFNDGKVVTTLLIADQRVGRTSVMKVTNPLFFLFKNMLAFGSHGLIKDTEQLDYAKLMEELILYEALTKKIKTYDDYVYKTTAGSIWPDYYHYIQTSTGNINDSK